MAMKFICDICNDEDGVGRCLSANLDLCGQCHVGFHDLFRSTKDRLIKELDQERSNVLDQLKRSSSKKSAVVSRIK